MVSERFPASLIGFMRSPYNQVYNRGSRALFTPGKDMGDRQSQSPPRNRRDDEIMQRLEQMATTQDRTLQNIEALMRHLVRGNRRNDHNDDRDDRSIAGSQHEQGTWSTTANRPTRPTFRPETPPPTPNDLERDIRDELRLARQEWEDLPGYVQNGWTFDRYLNYRANRQKQVEKQSESQQVTNKLTLPTFDGSGKMTARAWIHKVDTFLSLKTMTEFEALKYATLHLDGAAHDWWMHDMITLQHNQVTTYQEFVDKLIERFDKKDPEVYFWELAQLRQTGGLEQFINDFQKLAVMVPDISERRLVILFTEGLTEPLKGWVKAFDPLTLQEAMKKARSMELAAPANRFGSKGSSSFKDNRGGFNKGKEKVDDTKGKSAAPLDRETLNDLRKKKLCFFCKGPYEFGHDCPMRPKGKANRVMWAYYEGSDSDSSEYHDPDDAE